MNRFTKNLILVVLLFLTAVEFVKAQNILGVSTKREYSGFFDSYYYRGPLGITGGVGTSMYMGDLSSGYGTPGLAYNIGVNYKFWPRTVFGIEYHHQSLAATSSDSIPATFKGSNWGLNFYGRLYIVEDIIRKAQDRRTNKKVKPYITAGVGFIRFKSTGTYGAKSALTAGFPAGLGIECKISNRFQVIPEFTHMFTFNDRIDVAPLGKGKDGFSQLVIKVQYCPFAPKKKKKMKTAPADPNQHREEHQEWRKKKEKPKPIEEPLPGEENTDEEPKEEGTEETPTEEQPMEETPTEEKPTE